VPGSFELTFAAKQLADHKEIDAVIVLGCVVRGDTPHFDYVCDSVTQGITELNLMYDIPFIFGLLTTDNMQQAEDRAGGIHGNKGDECAISAIKMCDFVCKL
ncbi:MAG: 6,7-dimethyl-8-ribityllumazine synthase, partial [Bacteroidales bacterium]